MQRIPFNKSSPDAVPNPPVGVSNIFIGEDGNIYRKEADGSLVALGQDQVARQQLIRLETERTFDPATSTSTGFATGDLLRSSTVSGVNTRNGGKLFRVLAPGTTTGIHKTTPGGTKLAAQPMDRGAVNLRQFSNDDGTNVVGGTSTDFTQALQKALNTGNDVIWDRDTINVQGVTTGRDGQQLILTDRSILQGISGKGVPMIRADHDFARVVDGMIIGADPTQDIITTGGGSNNGGFRAFIDNVNITGTSLNCIVANKLETHVLFGKQKGATQVGVKVNASDAYLLGAYPESCGHSGVFANGVGSINAYHVHAFNNRRGFFGNGASFSVFMSCYADTSWEHGWYQEESAAGFEMTDCWGFKSGSRQSTAPGEWFDYVFKNVRNTTMKSLRSSSDDFNKAGSFWFNGNMHGTTVDGAYAGILPRLTYTGYLRFTNGKAQMGRLNMEANANAPLGAQTINAGSYRDYEVCLPNLVNQEEGTVIGVEITSFYDFPALAAASNFPSLEIDIGAIGVGFTASRPFAKSAATPGGTSNIAITNAVLATDSLSRRTIQFRASNNGPAQIRYAPKIKLLGHSRGISVGAPL